MWCTKWCLITWPLQNLNSVSLLCTELCSRLSGPFIIFVLMLHHFPWVPRHRFPLCFTLEFSMYYTTKHVQVFSTLVLSPFYLMAHQSSLLFFSAQAQVTNCPSVDLDILLTWPLVCSGESPQEMYSLLGHRCIKSMASVLFFLGCLI